MFDFFNDLFSNDTVSDFVSACEDWADKKDFKPDVEFDCDWDMDICEETLDDLPWT